MPFKPKHLRNFSEAELEALEKLNLGDGSPSSPKSAKGAGGYGDSSPMTPSKLSSTTFGGGSVGARKVDLEALEKKAEEGVNGHG